MIEYVVAPILVILIALAIDQGNRILDREDARINNGR